MSTSVERSNVFMSVPSLWSDSLRHSCGGVMSKSSMQNLVYFFALMRET